MILLFRSIKKGQLLSTIDHPYRNINGLLRLNLNNDDNDKTNNLEIYYVKHGKRWDGEDFYHSDDNNRKCGEKTNVFTKGI